MRAAGLHCFFVVVVKPGQRSCLRPGRSSVCRLPRFRIGLFWWSGERGRHTRLQAVIDHVENFDCLENFRRAAEVVRMRMCGDEVVELLDVVALQRFDNCFALRRVSGIDEHMLARR